MSVVCNLHFTLSLPLTSGLRSAVRSPQSRFYTDRSTFLIIDWSWLQFVFLSKLRKDWAKFLDERKFKARLHKRFLSRQLDAIFVALKLQQVSNTFEPPAISRQQIALKTAPGLHVRFWSCNLSATKIVSSCDKNRLCKRALFRRHNVTWNCPYSDHLF